MARRPSGPRPPRCRGFDITLERHTPRSVGLLWMSNQPVAETSTRHHTTRTRDGHPRPPARVDPTVQSSEQPQTHALDHSASRLGNK